MNEKVVSALKGKRVVVTRAADQSTQLAAELRERGAVPVMLPMVAFAAPDNLAFLDETIRHLRSYHWVFFTSQNALRAVQQRCSALKLEVREAFAGVKIAAVGPATADAVENAGLHVSYVATKHQATALAEELGEEVRGKRVLLPRSDRANPELVDTLEGFGARVFEVCAYKTVRADSDAREALKVLERKADVVLFFSPSAVHHLRDSMGKEKFLELSHQSAFAAIGPVTEEALRNAGVARVLLARDTTVEAVVATLAEYFEHKVPPQKARV